MTSAYTQVTHEHLEALGRDTPPPTSQQATSDEAVEKCRVRGLMTALQRHREGRQYLQELGITEVGLDGILYGGLEPSLANLEDLRRKLKAKNDMLRLQDPPAKRLEEAKNSVLNIVRELLYGGPSYHLVLVQEKDVIIDDYADAKIRFKGSEKDRESLTWWESKHAALSIGRDKADQNPNILIPQELEEAVNEISERLDDVRKQYRKLVNGGGFVDRWIQSIQGNPLEKRRRRSDEEHAASTSRDKRRRLSEETTARTGVKQPAVAMPTCPAAKTTAAHTDVIPSRRSTRKPLRRSQAAATSHPVRSTVINTSRISGGNRGVPKTQLRRQTRKIMTRSQAGALGERQQARQKSRIKPATTRSSVRMPNAGSMSDGWMTTRTGRESRKPLRYPYTELRKADVSVVEGRFTNSSGIAFPAGQ
ncbi:hypothetical protein IF1G_06886 [Cordyceps javanica]|uniref:Uncharacterized protein n=1 Tax=Cordyceps javanica TaxID=43265 RepID=A0A545UZH6_9HYPO|nr:hypothetical protein IF1G_06886 [Cordyceps javanica]TQW06742.1 hypothetical protein IF2G_06164 [Cordyceps javanica]